MLEQNNTLVKSFLSLRDLMQKNGIPDDVKLVIHTHEEAKPGNVQNYNVPEAREVAALNVGEQLGKLDIVLKRRSEYDVNGFEKLDFIKLGHRMCDPLAFPLLFPHGKKSGILCSSITIPEETYNKFHQRSFIPSFCLKEQVTSMCFSILGGFLSNTYVK